MTTTPSSSVFAGARRSYASPWPVPGRATAEGNRAYAQCRCICQIPMHMLHSVAALDNS